MASERDPDLVVGRIEFGPKTTLGDIPVITSEVLPHGTIRVVTTESLVRENERLRAEVERLTREGNMAKGEHDSRDYVALWEVAATSLRERDEARAERDEALLGLGILRAKRSVEGLNGRCWDGGRHLDAEEAFVAWEARNPPPDGCLFTPVYGHACGRKWCRACAAPPEQRGDER